MGDIDPAKYQRRRADLPAEREALPVETTTSEDVVRRLAGFLADLPSAWAVATPEECNKLARQLFAEAVIENRTVVAVKPRPELLPFFESALCQEADEMTVGPKRRGSVSSPRHDATGTEPIDIAVVPPRCVSGKSRRVAYQTPRLGMLSNVQKAWIRAYADTRSLREMAADFGVSHETVRAVLRQAGAA